MSFNMYVPTRILFGAGMLNNLYEQDLPGKKARIVISNEKYKVKTGREYPKCNPKFAMLDLEYTCSVPMEQMVSGGFY